MDNNWIINIPARATAAEHLTLTLGEPFFEAAEHADLLGGHVIADVDLVPSGPHWRINIHCHGTIRTTCDRCCGPMEAQVDEEYEAPLMPSAGGLVPPGDDSDAVYFDPVSGRADLLRPLADTLALSLGLTHQHAPGQCDPALEAALDHRPPEANTPLADALSHLAAGDREIDDPDPDDHNT